MTQFYASVLLILCMYAASFLGLGFADDSSYVCTFLSSKLYIKEIFTLISLNKLKGTVLNLEILKQ